VRRVSTRVTRPLLLLLALASPAAAQETRLGTLIRFYLAENRPSRQSDLVEKIRRLVGDDVQKVIRAIRLGEHRRYGRRPQFEQGAPEPRFFLERPRIQDMRGSAGDFARLLLPANYDSTRAYPLVLDLGAPRLPVPEDSVVVRIAWARHSQAREAAAVEGLVLSLLVRTMDLVHIDASRVTLRGIGKETAAMAFYIALNNPDRLAGIVTGGGSWPEAPKLSDNSRYFRILAIDRRRGDPSLQRFFSLPGMASRHALLRAPRDPGLDKRILYPPILAWHKKVRRESTPTTIRLKAGREVATRAYWIRVAPRRRAIRNSTLGGLLSYRSLSVPGTLIAEVDRQDTNLIHVRTHRVTAFRIYVDPAMFERDRALRVRINGGVPIANLIDHNLSVEAVLEDYRERRDPELLYAASFTYSVRREPASPPK